MLKHEYINCVHIQKTVFKHEYINRVSVVKHTWYQVRSTPTVARIDHLSSIKRYVGQMESEVRSPCAITTREYSNFRIHISHMQLCGGT